jgi:DNA (cytosine-5)-methyltransferase 1
MDLGFQKAGFEPVWANDIDPSALDTYRGLLPGHPTITGDIYDIASLPGLGAADLVIGGPPCQGFSVAGDMDPKDPRNNHVYKFFEVVERVQPRAFVMENVKSLAVSDRWADFRERLNNRAINMGFDAKIFLLNASHFNVPQARERMFFIGINRNEGSLIAPRRVSEAKPPTLRSALQTLPAYGAVGNDSICNAIITPLKKPIMRKSPWAGRLFNGGGRPMWLDRPAPTLSASMGGNATPIIDQDQLENGGESWTEAYHRHLWSGGLVCTTIPDQLRRITVEEAAAIQTFPLSTKWSGGHVGKYRQIGNAVPPELAYHVALSVVESLYGT